MLGTPVVRTRASARAEQAYRRILGQAVVGSRTSGCRGAAVGRMGTKLPAVLVELLAQGWRCGGWTRGCRVKVVVHLYGWRHGCDEGGGTDVLGRSHGCREGGGTVEKCVWSRL